jgi:hypothetical protein
MKLQKVFPIIAVLMVALTSSCSEDLNNNVSPEKSAVEKSAASTLKMSEAKTSADIQPESLALTGINLGVAGDFVILSKTGITDVYKSAVTGDVGSSPITGAAVLLKYSEVTGTIYTVDAAGPLPCSVTNATRLTTSIGDMQTAYTDAAGRLNPDYLNLGAGNIGGMTLIPGLYKWTSGVLIPADINISGGPDDIFIFQVAGTLEMSSAVRVTLSGGAQAKNIFWVSAGAVTFGTTSHFEGTILGKTGINLKTGATINGRLLAQTAVTLQMNTVVMPQ